MTLPYLEGNHDLIDVVTLDTTGEIAFNGGPATKVSARTRWVNPKLFPDESVEGLG